MTHPTSPLLTQSPQTLYVLIAFHLTDIMPSRDNWTAEGLILAHGLEIHGRAGTAFTETQLCLWDFGVVGGG